MLRLQDIEQQLGRGQLHAIFSENAAQGQGLPVWVYYSQWVYWPAVALRSLGASPLVSLKIVYCLFLVACCVGCYQLLRLHTDRDTSAFGTILFMTSNYVISMVFARSVYAEFSSIALLPLLLFTLHRTVVQGDRIAGTGLVFFASLIVLFHPLTFMNIAGAVAAYSVYVAIGWRIPYRRLLLLPPLFALALGLTAFYWVPAVIEMGYVLGARGVPTPVTATFLTIIKYLNFAAVTNMGLVLNLCVATVAVALLLRHRLPQLPARRPSWPLVAGILMYVFLTLRISEPLYTHVSFLASNLWVWRVLFPMVLLLVILVIDNLELLPQRLRSGRVIGAVAGLAVLQAVVFVVWRTAPYFSISPTDPQAIEGALAYEGQQMRGFGIDEYLPDTRIIPSPGDVCRESRSISSEGQNHLSFEIAASDAGTCIHIPRFWNVRYAASIDGESTPVYGNADGEILIVPAGRHGRFQLHVAQPAYVTRSMQVSGVAAAMFFLGVAWSLVPAFGRVMAGASDALCVVQVPKAAFFRQRWRVLRTRRRFWLTLIVLLSLLLGALLLGGRGPGIAPVIYVLS